MRTSGDGGSAMGRAAAGYCAGGKLLGRGREYWACSTSGSGSGSSGYCAAAASDQLASVIAMTANGPKFHVRMRLPPPPAAPNFPARGGDIASFANLRKASWLGRAPAILEGAVSGCRAQPDLQGAS